MLTTAIRQLLVSLAARAALNELVKQEGWAMAAGKSRATPRSSASYAAIRGGHGYHYG